MGAEAVAKYRAQIAQNLTCAVLEDAKSVVSREFYHLQPHGFEFPAKWH